MKQWAIPGPNTCELPLRALGNSVENICAVAEYLYVSEPFTYVLLFTKTMIGTKKPSTEMFLIRKAAYLNTTDLTEETPVGFC